MPSRRSSCGCGPRQSTKNSFMAQTAPGSITAGPRALFVSPEPLKLVIRDAIGAYEQKNGKIEL